MSIRPGETNRLTVQQDDGSWSVEITGGISANATANSMPEANGLAEARFDIARRSLLPPGEASDVDTLVDRLAEVVFYHNGALQNGGHTTGLPRWSKLTEQTKDIWRKKAEFYMKLEANSLTPVRGRDDA